jgi:signal transduction histidine kinase
VNERTARRLAGSLAAFAIAAISASIGIRIAADPRAFDPVDLVYVGAGTAFGVVGSLISGRRPANPIGWLFVSVAVGVAFDALLISVGGLDASGSASETGRVAEWLEGWTWVPLIFVPTIFPLLLFPDGRLPSRRWRPFVWMGVLGVVAFSFSMAFDPRSYGGELPISLRPPEALVEAAALGALLLIASLAAAAVAIAVRFRRSSGEERQQLTWLTYAGTTAAIFIVGSFAAGGILDTVGVDVDGGPVGDLLNLLVIAGMLLIPVAMAVGILKYRLYDIDLVIKKTVVYAILAVLLFLLGVVPAWVTAGFVFELTGESEISWALAGLVVGIALWPLRRVSRKIADRIVFGKRATPYEVLTEFSTRVAETYAAEDVLVRMAQVLGEAVGADAATVWLGRGGRARPVATWPPDAVTDGAFPASAFEVRHQGRTLGALSVEMPPRDPMTPAKERLIRDLAGQAGLVLRNGALIEDLKASRQRLVAAQDAERRRIERNIHDGAQQQLVALAVKQRLAATLIGKDDARARTLHDELQADTDRALEDLRDLARGIYPPLLADRGLGAAIEGQARKSPVPVHVDTDRIGRYPQETEAAVYFSTLEALQNVAKYAEASRASVRLAQANGTLTFEVSDDGRGFDPDAAERGTGLQGIADRLAALGGELEVTSAPGDGTTVSGRVPIEGASP